MNDALSTRENDMSDFMHIGILKSNKIDTAYYIARGKGYAELKAGKHWIGKAETWNSYLSSIGKSRKRIEDKIKVYKTFVIDLNIPLENLSQYTPEQLEAICPVVKQDPDYWFEQCSLSLKDLINASRETRGKKPMPIQKATSLPPGSSCIICDSTPVEDAHWPITKKMGGKFTLPLCHECHMGFLHTKGDGTFYMAYKHKIMEWLATL